MKTLLLIAIVTVSVICNAEALMVGGWSKVDDVNNPDFQKVVSFASAKVSESSNSLYHMKSIKVSDAKKQIVSGVNYDFKMTMAATECKKNRNDVEDISKCDLLQCGPVESCRVRVWDQPWIENGMKVTNHTCTREPKSC